MTIEDRIRDLRRVKANQLLPHPANCRQHPPAQLAALKGILDQVGWADANQEALDELLDSISTQSEALHEMLEGLRVDKWGISEGEFPELPDGDKTTLPTCPSPSLSIKGTRSSR